VVIIDNPAVSLPDADGGVADAMRNVPFVVTSRTSWKRPTPMIWPMSFYLQKRGWAKKTGTVTNSERRVSRQRAFFRAPGSARPDWKIISDVGRRMGFR